MAEQPAVTTRRREVGSASARSLLLTVLGEFVHPRAEPVWTATLLEALGALGVEEKSARQALTRTSSEHLLTSTRHGRRVRWELTPDGAQLLEEGTRRIYGFMRERHPWDPAAAAAPASHPAHLAGPRLPHLRPVGHPG